MEFHQYTLTTIDFGSVSRYSYFSWMDSALANIQVNVVEMEFNQATFQVLENYRDFRVMVIYRSPVTSLFCNCGETGFCSHQKATLTRLFGQENWLSFFDFNRYRNLLKKIAVQYGLEHEPLLENYFSAHIKDAALQFVLKDKHLTSIDDFDLLEPQTRPAKIHSEQLHSFIVLTRNRYYKQLQVLLCQAPLSKSGTPKNPISTVESQSRIWQTDSIDETQFFAAISQLAQPLQQTDTPIGRSLRAIAKNPLALDFFLHDYEKAENITATSLSPIQIGLSKGEIKLLIEQRGSFYCIKGELSIHGITYELQDLTILFDHFIAIKKYLYLVENKLHLKLIRLFGNKGNELRIHRNKFKEFNELFLAPLANSVALNFKDIPKANKPQLKENLYYQDMQALIFLEESEDFVNIIPVMRYGDVEVPILSKRNIFGTDAKGSQFLVERKKEAETKVISLLLKQHTYFQEQLDDDSFQHLYLHRKYFLDKNWFLNAFEEWHQHGVQIIGFNTIRGNKLSRFKGKIQIEVLSGQNWFNANIQVKFGPKSVSLKKLEKAVRNRSQFIPLDDGTLGVLPQEWLEKFEAYFNAAEVIEDEHLQIPKFKFNEIDQLFSNEEIDHAVSVEIDYLRNQLSTLASYPPVQLPDIFVGDLRHYQQQGVQWLNFLDKLNFGACLADDMGLGKTVQILAFLATQKAKGITTPTLLVLPTTLIFNWKREIEQFLPSFNTLVLEGPNRRDISEQFEELDIVLISYHNLLTDINRLKKLTFNYVILDESQYIKNPDSQRYKAVNLLRARNRIILTGTPIENNTMDLFAQLSFAIPGLFGNKKYFKDVYTTPIDAFHDRKRKKMLKEKIKPFILRRTKRDVLDDLPAKNELVLYCEMKTAQRRIYDLYEKEFREFISAKDGDEIKKSPMHVLKGLTKLRQICNSSKLLQSEDLTSAEDSAKIEMLIEQIQHKKDQHKIIVFSQFVSMLHLIKEALDKNGIPSLTLTGQSRNRGQLVSDFQSNEDSRVFLISLKAGGTGLNLTAADVVYLVDPWWNPAVEQQAIDRIYRIGQQKNVTAVRLISPNTVEDKIQALQQHKKEISSTILEDGGSLDAFYLDKDYLLKILR
ncbi:DEAD/DEAH box helicase [Sphingobacterium sp. DR205]|uniref:DEAD/DEAH box helicase n=1 Tax=Sphingobacterium sp. DR205 TaxID=2713573 RepID=UPI0013E43E03|nr:DEAD/DEAH box helicase [Sphingobacterium sp. DR205]QIH32442.1 DEAD/DEAH box helicase family protein [Sphingobacterium sp. DR205]